MGTSQTLLSAATVGIAAIVAAMAAGPAQAGPAYTIQDLMPATGTARPSAAIGPSGQVVVNSGGRAYLYSGGTFTDLLTLGGAVTNGYAVNASGQVVGASAKGVVLHAFRWAGGTMTDLGALGGDARPSEACAINGSGAVVGASYNNDDLERAFLHDGSMHDLGTLGGDYSRAYGINTAGKIVGWAEDANLRARAFLYSAGQMNPLGTLGGTTSEARAINDSDKVAGFSATSQGRTHAFLYDGALHDLSTLGGLNSEAWGINSAGDVVGRAQISGGAWRAFLYTGSAMTDLNTLLPSGSGWTLDYAWGIDDRGTIVGEGLNPTGQRHTYLLTPEPATMSLLALGGAAILFLRRRPAGACTPGRAGRRAPGRCWTAWNRSSAGRSSRRSRAPNRKGGRHEYPVPNGIKLRVFGPFSNGWSPAEPGRKAAPRPFGGWSACLQEGPPGLILMPLYCVPGIVRDGQAAVGPGVRGFSSSIQKDQVTQNPEGAW
ncbi:MAG: PEP-CTERM sorting domain-containing protein [Planctomycetota bacterium]|nr:PEP-CTERM sorting domain-containing protein [Planctomycetota bacterium]